ncbi:MAG TPA: hypothetical protein ENJ64_06675 [Thiotrichales bacterium]|nr:hypothetical protein [Thiotrichales bacterium]
MFAGLVVNKENLGIVFTAFKTAFMNHFRDTATYWEQIATRVPSTSKSEKYGWIGQFPRLRKWLGDRQVKSLALHDYTIVNEKYEGTIGISRDDIDDDSYGMLTPVFSDMGYAAATHPDELVFDLLARGFTELCYDGQFFFDTDHPVGNEDTGIVSVANMQAGVEAPWFLLDTRRPLKPLIFQVRRDYDLKSKTDPNSENVWNRDEFEFGVDARVSVGFGFWQMAFGSKATLSQQNFDDNYAAMMALKSDEGRPLGIMPNVLVCGPSNRAAAKSVIKAQRLANGASNTNFEAVELLVVPWLA